MLLVESGRSGSAPIWYWLRCYLKSMRTGNGSRSGSDQQDFEPIAALLKARRKGRTANDGPSRRASRLTDGSLESYCLRLVASPRFFLCSFHCGFCERLILVDEIWARRAPIFQGGPTIWTLGAELS
jgi:hypothetical protein